MPLWRGMRRTRCRLRWAWRGRGRCGARIIRVAALLGDGALTGGLAYEGLNNAGISREPMVVILNDNGMSITRNVGAISRYLARARRGQNTSDSSCGTARRRRRPPQAEILRLTHKVKERMRRSLLGTTLFETLGFTYLGRWTATTWRR